MADNADFVAALAAVNAASPFNQLAGFEIEEAQAGAVTLKLDMQEGAGGAKLLNHAGALHAGVQAALLDTACGYAAGTVAGNVVTLQLNLQFLSSAKGDRFEARARVTKEGKAGALRGRGPDRSARLRGGAGGQRDCGAGEGGLAVMHC